MARELTEAAKAAKEIRQYLKAKGIKARVVSDNFSMGSSVDVYITDQPPEVVKQIEKDIDKYEYGSFDPMTDCQGIKNRDFSGPQAKYVHTHNEHSLELKQACWNFIRPIYQGADLLAEKYEDLNSWDKLADDFAHTIVYRVLVGAWDQGTSKEFWADYLKPEPPKPIESTTIGEYTHTKKGFQMFIVTLPGRVEREEYLKLLDTARSLGGWYSRKWGATPAGFAFKDLDQAREFSTYIQDPETNSIEPKEKPVINKALKLRRLAANLQKQIDDKLVDRQTNTPKRLKQAAHARLEGEQLKRTQDALNALADLWDLDQVPAIVQDIDTKTAVYDLMATKKESIANGYHSYSICTGQPYYNTEVAKFLWSLIKAKSPEDLEKEKLERDKKGLQFSNIPGFFPTPEGIAELMFSYADIEAGMCVLEPSAGTGSLIKPIVDSVDTEILAYEYNSTLVSILSKSFPSYRVHVEQADFLEVNDFKGQYPRIIMNPPFDRGQDIQHIKHAIDFLAPGGKLVALCANGPRQEKELMPLADHWEVLPDKSFKESGTGVNVALMVINN